MDPIAFAFKIESLTRLEDVWRALVASVRPVGISRIGYHHLPPPGAPDAGLLRVENAGFGEALLQQYLSARARGIAALAALLQNTVRPIYLDEMGSLDALTPREAEHLSEYRLHGVENGLGIQVFGPNGRNGILAIDLHHSVRLRPEVLETLRWVCQAMHLRYCELLIPALGKMPSLSSREAEILGWVARGKSNVSIAEILGISAHTVDAHLRRIYLKLGVYDRMSAALRGLGFGLLPADALS
ncbi:MAG: LuxR C-terminal-related transcriptional regulator [Amaricoccus sp.]|uniref:helix-turn-helix transcriptional regulator n=1 Tax=Amaricoccus sp. TaxID=1872485 RepID=UPI0039E66077